MSNGELLEALSGLRIRVAALRPVKLTNDSAGVCKIHVGGREIEAAQLARALNLPSANITRIELRNHSETNSTIIFYGL